MKAKSVLYFVLLLLCGCVPHTSIEDTALVNVVAYDFVEEGVISGTTIIPQFKQDEAGGEEELLLGATGKSVKEVQRNIENKSPFPLRMGKVSMIFYGNRLAEEGLNSFVDVLQRDPNIGRDVYVGIVDGTAEELIKGTYSETQTTGEYIKSLIRQNTTKYIPTQNLQKFLYAYYSEGMDPSLPLFRRLDGKMELSGYALFRGDKMVYSIPFQDAFILKMLSQSFNDGLQAMEYQGARVVMENIGSKVDYDIGGTFDQPEYTISIDIRGIIGENTSLQEGNFPTKNLEEAFTSFFEANGERLIKEMQEQRVDPLGLGEVWKNRIGKFDKNVWDSVYPSIPIKVRANVRIFREWIDGIVDLLLKMIIIFSYD
ncbi:Ger(x)C family spore germination protein [Halobacillus sp. BAB-2008]|uniref:Ger(x)C family spore germination protein n=1 Tax=Halobacillus sp. BAB-2008 TaxID=1246484 RepID=UPI00187BCBC4|nr:Ger(x)C family spore germination protein [Halobacillus sp. BAB-2008]